MKEIAMRFILSGLVILIAVIFTVTVIQTKRIEPEATITPTVTTIVEEGIVLAQNMTPTEKNEPITILMPTKTATRAKDNLSDAVSIRGWCDKAFEDLRKSQSFSIARELQAYVFFISLDNVDYGISFDLKKFMLLTYKDKKLVLSVEDLRKLVMDRGRRILLPTATSTTISEITGVIVALEEREVNIQEFEVFADVLIDKSCGILTARVEYDLRYKVRINDIVLIKDGWVIERRSHDKMD